MSGSSERLRLALDGIRERWSPLPFVKVLREPLRFAHGLMNGIAVRGAGPGALGLLGISATLFVLAALLSAFVVGLRRPWTRIAVRVAGSWIAATGLLLLGWSFRRA